MENGNDQLPTGLVMGDNDFVIDTGWKILLFDELESSARFNCHPAVGASGQSHPRNGERKRKKNICMSICGLGQIQDG